MDLTPAVQSKFWLRSAGYATLAANTHQSEVQKAAASMVTMLKFGGDGQNRFVLAEAHHGQWFVGSGGVSTYMTRPKLRVSSAYSILDK